MRSCVLPEGLARRRRGLSLSKKRLFIAVWITGRGMSESPWIAGRSERASITDVPQCGEAAKSVQSAGIVQEDVAKTVHGHTGKGTQRQNLERDTALSQQTSLLLEKEGGVWWTGLYLIS